MRLEVSSTRALSIFNWANMVLKRSRRFRKSILCARNLSSDTSREDTSRFSWFFSCSCQTLK